MVTFPLVKNDGHIGYLVLNVVIAQKKKLLKKKQSIPGIKDKEILGGTYEIFR